MSNIRVVVTAEQIQRGQPGCGECPVALAFRDLGFPRVSVGTNDIVIFFGATPVSVKLPPIVRDFILDWDSGYQVSPLTFWVDLRSVMADLREVGYKFLPKIV
jgi:hypothetical protein